MLVGLLLEPRWVGWFVLGWFLVLVIFTLAMRMADGRQRIPFRPDHGHELLDDIGKAAFPGYSAIGRLKGLAEIRGVMTAVASRRGLPV